MATTGAFADLVTGNEIKTIYPGESLEPLCNVDQTVRPRLNKTLPSGTKPREGVVKIAAYLSPPQNQAVIGDAALFPYMKDRTSTIWTITPTVFAAGFQIGGVTRAAANTNASAWNGGEWQRRIEETMSNVGKDMERHYCAISGGIRCYVNAATTDTYNFTARIAGPVQTQGDFLLEDNHLISIRIAADSTARDACDGRKITNIDRTTHLVTFDGTADCTLVAADPVYVVSDGASLTGGAIQALTGIHPNSIRGAVDDGSIATTWHGVTRSGIASNKAYGHVVSGAVRKLDPTEIYNLARNINRKSGGKVDTLLMGWGLAQEYNDLLMAGRRVMNDGKSLTGTAIGFDPKNYSLTMPWGAIKIMVADDVLPRELFLLTWDTFCLYQAQPMGWIEDGGGVAKMIPGSGRWVFGFQALAAAVENLICTNPAKNGVIRNIADPTYSDEVGVST